MLSKETEKTKSAPKRPARVPILICLVVVLLIIAALVGLKHRADTSSAKDYTLALSKQSSIKYKLAPVTSNADKEKGLGNTPSLATDHGMIFLYSQSSEQCFWMKDMHYPLDIIWANSTKQVTHIEHNLAPSSYPKTYCAEAQYVIELNAGEAAKSDLQRGQTLSF